MLRLNENVDELTSSVSRCFVLSGFVYSMRCPPDFPVRMRQCYDKFLGTRVAQYPKMLAVVKGRPSHLDKWCRYSLRWRHNDHDSVSNHQPHGCLLNRLFRRRSKKTSKLSVTGFVWGIHRDRWIPRTKGQLRGKWFHLMTSSWVKCSSGPISQTIFHHN